MLRQVTPVELKEYLDVAEPPPVLLDVREDWEFEECRIEGSVHIPLAQLARGYEDLDPERETIVICHHGIRSVQAAQFLAQKGFTNVMHLAGGVDAWAREVDPDMSRY